MRTSTCHNWSVGEWLNLNSVSCLKPLHTLNYPDSPQLTSNIPHLSSHINHHSSLTPHPLPLITLPPITYPSSLTPHHFPLITHPSSFNSQPSSLTHHHSPLITSCLCLFCQKDVSITAIYCIFNQKCAFLLGFLLFEKIFYSLTKISRNLFGILRKFCENQWFYFREIQNNFVIISCFAKF